MVSDATIWRARAAVNHTSFGARAPARVPVDRRDDDNGISGGALERPSLQRLLADIEAVLVEVVVTAIDRLTSYLARVLRPDLSAPDIVEAIPDGRRRESLQREDLCTCVPAIRDERRMRAVAEHLESASARAPPRSRLNAGEGGPA